MYLVTGCAGFIGSNLCRYLLLVGEQVTGIDALKTGSNPRNLDGLDMKWDNRDVRRISDLVPIFKYKNITHVIHLAAQTHVDRSIDNSFTFWDTNVMGTRTLLDIAKGYEVQVFINQITDEVYGAKPIDEAHEGDVLRPTSPYPCSKAAQYYVGRSYYETWDMPVISTFPVNCYGPRQSPEKLIPKFVTKLLAGEKVPLMKSTYFQRDWLPVIDLCRALYIISKNGVAGEDYNIGADNHHTNIDLTYKLLDLCGRDKSYIELVPDRAVHDSRYAVSSDRIHALGWEIDNDFDEYLRFTVDWYQGKALG